MTDLEKRVVGLEKLLEIVCDRIKLDKADIWLFNRKQENLKEAIEICNKALKS